MFKSPYYHSPYIFQSSKSINMDLLSIVPSKTTSSNLKYNNLLNNIDNNNITNDSL